MKSKEEIEQLAKELCNIPIGLVIDEEERYYKNFQKYDGIILGYTKCQENMANDINRKLDLLIGICEKRISDCVVNKLNISEVDTQGMLFAYKTFKQYINKQD